MEYAVEYRDAMLGAKLGRLPRGLAVSDCVLWWLLEASDRIEVLPREGRPVARRSVDFRFNSCCGFDFDEGGRGRAPPGRLTRLSRRFAKYAATRC